MSFVPRQALLIVLGCLGCGEVHAVAAEAAPSRASGGSGGGVNGGGCDPWPTEELVDPAATEPQPNPALAGVEHRYFGIHVVDADSGDPVPGARLTTVNQLSLVTDENGRSAFYEPGLMGTTVFFFVTHPGYEAPADGFGFRGQQLQVAEGAEGTIELTRGSGDQPRVMTDLPTRQLSGAVPGRAECLALRFVSADGGRGVPAVVADFSTDGSELYVSDSQGYVAYCNPDRLGQKLSARVTTDGYVLESPDAVQDREAHAGSSWSVRLRRTSLGERLYRLTGEGIYDDSVRLGLSTPLERPLYDSQVALSDSVGTTLFRGELWWTWGKTDRAAHPLGQFRGSLARSQPASAGGLSSDQGVNFEYLAKDDESFVSSAIEEFEPNSPTWIGSPAVVSNDMGEQLYVDYAKVDGNLAAVERGVARWNDDAQKFERVGQLPLKDFEPPRGQTCAVTAPDGARYLHYSDGLRVSATESALTDAAQYQRFTAVDDSGALVRDGDALVYDWRTARATTRADVGDAKLGSDQLLDQHGQDVVSGRPVDATEGSLGWSEYRRRFLQVARNSSSSVNGFGALVLTEGDTPLGPFVYATELVTHQSYSFLNPVYHPELDRALGRFIYVEGSYRADFSPAPQKLPRYDINQLMYRVDLDDARAILPVPIYEWTSEQGLEVGSKERLTRDVPALAAPFFAPERAAPGLVAVGFSDAACAPREVVVGKPAEVLFYALPEGDRSSATGTLELFADTNGAGAQRLSVATTPVGGFTRGDVIAHVWPNPLAVPLPVGDYLGDLLAAAGPDRCVSAPADGSVAVTLDASGSSSLSGESLSYRWQLRGPAECESFDSRRITLDLRPGLYTAELWVETRSGRRARDQALIRVSGGGS